MKLTPHEKQTIEAYDQNAAAWAKSRNIAGYWAVEKKKFQKYLPEGQVLEIGAGGGRDAKVNSQKYSNKTITKFLNPTKPNTPTNLGWFTS